MRRGFVLSGLMLLGCGDNIVPPTERPTGFVCDDTTASGTSTLLLVFDGLMLTDAGRSDARYDQAGFVDNDNATLPPWRPIDPDRAAFIDDITCRIRESLFPYDIRVTRKRPFDPDDYEMIVFGGTAADLGKPTSLRAVVDSDCNDVNHRDVAWVADGATVEATAGVATAMFAAGMGLVPSADATNCTCLAGAGSGCDMDLPCAFSETANVRPNDDFCQTGLAVQDQVTTLADRYGVRAGAR